MNEDLRQILDAGLAAADPAAAVRRHLEVDDDRIKAGGANFAPDRVFVVAAGKAACAMAAAVEGLLGDRISGGLVVTKAGHEAPLERLEVVSAAHPEPDEGGVEAARRVAELLEGLEEDDLLLALVSGGASALLADPAPPIELPELQELTGDLLRSGASIDEINCVRKHVSVLKGGGLVRLAAPARTLALLLSDVVGDHVSSIASGPTAPDPTTLQNARRVLERYGIDPPPSIAEHLTNADETPKPGDPLFAGVTNIICGGGRHSVEAAAAEAGRLGYRPLILSTLMTGEAREVAGVHAAITREALESGNPAPPPCALISGGELTITVRGKGKGGPNQEFTLALALALEGVESWSAFAADTDGNDGPTEAAGGAVDGTTAAAIRESGTDPEAALADNDSNTALETAGALIETGPTGTNVNDLRVILVDNPR